MFLYSIALTKISHSIARTMISHPIALRKILHPIAHTKISHSIAFAFTPLYVRLLFSSFFSVKIVYGLCNDCNLFKPNTEWVYIILYQLGPGSRSI